MPYLAVLLLLLLLLLLKLKERERQRRRSCCCGCGSVYEMEGGGWMRIHRCTFVYGGLNSTAQGVLVMRGRSVSDSFLVAVP